MVVTSTLSDTARRTSEVNNAKLIRVLIVDDHQVVREGLRRMLETERDIKVIGEAVSGDEAVSKSLSLSPDVVTMDLKMPGKDGITAIKEIKQSNPGVDVLMLTLYAEDFVREALAAGASGYLLKDNDCEQIVSAIRQVSAGLCPIAPSLTRDLVSELSQINRHSQSSILTRRQKEILQMIADGVHCKEIGEKLFISTSTVKREIRQILLRLDAGDRAQAVSEAIKRGILK